MTDSYSFKDLREAAAAMADMASISFPANFTPCLLDIMPEISTSDFLDLAPGMMRRVK